METAATSTIAIAWSGIFSVLIWISDLVFRWLPATVSVIFGLPAPDGTYPPDYAELAQQESSRVVDVTTVGVAVNHAAVPPIEGLPGAAYSYGDPTTGGAVLETVTSSSGFLTSAWSVLAPVGLFFTLLFATFVVYVAIRIWQMKRAEAEHTHVADAAPESAVVEKTPQQKRWERIQSLAGSEHESDWRLAILEADIMLDEMLEAQGYTGDTIGDKLKQVEKSDFTTLEYAWEAHKVRNDVAHKGSHEHSLNQREAQRVIGLYEAVFREFYLV